MRGAALALAGSLVLGISCVEVPFPGSQLIGSFDFTARVPPRDSLPKGSCKFAEMPLADFNFNGTFSQAPGSLAFLTLGEVSHAAEFDGQYITSLASAPRRFDECACPDGTRMDETLKVALLSRSQVDALADTSQCPPNPLDGGVPPIGGSIQGPGEQNGSFDAVFACGELVDAVVPDESCSCEACTSVYPLQGIRR